MAITITVSAEGDRVIARLSHLLSPATLQMAHVAAGEEGAQLMREHFYGLHNERTRGGAGAGFYRRYGDNVFYRTEGTGVTFGVMGPRGLLQRRYGGKIKGNPWLTIPVNPKANHRRAREFDDLVFVRTGKPGVLILGRAQDGSNYVEAFYVLVPEVNQAPDPTVFPTTDSIRSAVLRGVRIAYQFQ